MSCTDEVDVAAQTTADYRSIAIGKTHLTNHFDFLEANDLMPHFLIQAINLSPSTPAVEDDPTAERTREVRLEMAKYVEESGKRYSKSWGDQQLNGWFEVLSLGVNYVILAVSSAGTFSLSSPPFSLTRNLIPPQTTPRKTLQDHTKSVSPPSSSPTSKPQTV